MLGPWWKLLWQGGNEARVVHFASILRQIAAYLSDFCSRTKPCRPPLARVKRGREGEDGKDDGGMRRLKWIGFVRIYGVYVSTNALISASRQRSSSPSISGYAREISASSRNYSIINDTRLHIVNVIIIPRSSRIV